MHIAKWSRAKMHKVLTHQNNHFERLAASGEVESPCAETETMWKRGACPLPSHDVKSAGR